MNSIEQRYELVDIDENFEELLVQHAVLPLNNADVRATLVELDEHVEHRRDLVDLPSFRRFFLAFGIRARVFMRHKLVFRRVRVQNHLVSFVIVAFRWARSAHASSNHHRVPVLRSDFLKVRRFRLFHRRNLRLRDIRRVAPIVPNSITVPIGPIRSIGPIGQAVIRGRDQRGAIHRNVARRFRFGRRNEDGGRERGVHRTIREDTALIVHVEPVRRGSSRGGRVIFRLFRARRVVFRLFRARCVVFRLPRPRTGPFLLQIQHRTRPKMRGSAVSRAAPHRLARFGSLHAL